MILDYIQCCEYMLSRCRVHDAMWPLGLQLENQVVIIAREIWVPKMSTSIISFICDTFWIFRILYAQVRGTSFHFLASLTDSYVIFNDCLWIAISIHESIQYYAIMMPRGIIA